MRVFLGGIVTETNTFSPITTGASEWEVVREVERAASGSALLAVHDEATARGDELVFGLSAFAMPAGVAVRQGTRRCVTSCSTASEAPCRSTR